MVDVNSLLASWLRTIAALVQVLPARGDTQSVYAVDLPSDFDPTLGPAIVVDAEGGLSEPEVQGIANVRFQVRILADVGEAMLARSVYSALYDNCNGKGNVSLAGIGTILSFYEITPPQELSDPDVHWATLIVFFQMIAR